MAHESFEDGQIAEILNNNYVSIKVDREERPDIDSIYMTVCQALTGQGGWPLNVFLTSDQKPFYAGTYFPKESMYGRPGFKDVLLSLKEQYDADPEKIAGICSQIVTSLSEKSQNQTALPKEILEKCFQQLTQTFDPKYGGFGQEPKFPSPHQLLYLLRYHRMTSDDEALQMVIKTLDGIANGGIHDHIGGGFARYSVDEKWLVPHFEKMLYDQALLAMAYTEAYQVVGNPRYKTIVKDIYTYVSRELQDVDGGFYCAEDADSEGVEGKYYVWEPAEVMGILGDDLGELFCEAYDITAHGNFEGFNIPNLIDSSLLELAKKKKISLDKLKLQLEDARSILLGERNRRIHPHKDDKSLASWNALMIGALAKAGKVFNNDEMIHAAKRALNFIDEKMTVKGMLKARYREGEAKFDAYLDDYAFLSWACDELYEATYESKYLNKMQQLIDIMLADFWDEDGHGFYLYSKNAAELILKPKDVFDGAIPSGNSAAAYVLLKLARRIGESDYEAKANKLFTAFSNSVSGYPMGYSFLLSAYLLTQSGSKELIILKGDNVEQFTESLSALKEHYLPEVVSLAGEQGEMDELAPNLAGYKTINDETTYYLCRNFQCEQPTIYFQEVMDRL
ncbi:hypothetical protein EV207_10244 [Scopulibacillus darangshiensis]|uniref:Spermatogenesis-associated protein 20-like TRX domain-containing protein n=1 Tax=Scopulibacillus darangshiensis TaxID=442528 RepID=A0A4R2PCA1_9BACL|nr:hypothetical protein EV207_10244 [Scopulibacillus darangshiensis]